MKYIIIYKDGEKHYHADEQILIDHLNALAENGALAEIEKIETKKAAGERDQIDREISRLQDEKMDNCDNVNKLLYIDGQIKGLQTAKEMTR